MSRSPRTRRRLLATLGTVGVGALAGCADDDAAAYPGTESAGEEGTRPPTTATGTTERPTEDPNTATDHTDSATETPSSTPTETATEILPAEGLEVAGRVAAVRDADGYAKVIARIDLENTGPHTYRVVELRVDVLYTDPTTGEATRVASGYAERLFESGFGEGTVRLRKGIRFLRDGRADGSLDAGDFSVAFELRHLDTL